MALLPWTLAWARLRIHSLRTFTIALSVALALVALLALQGISHSTGNSLITYSLSQLPEGDRTLTLTSSKIIASPDQFRSIDTYLSAHLSKLTSGELSPEIMYHEISDSHGVGFYVGGVDSLPRSVRLASGRLPRQCTPSSCEVIQIGGSGNSSPQVDRLGIKIVGRGNFPNSQLFSGTMAPSDGTALLVANGIAAVSALPHFANLQGATGWVGTMDISRIATDGADAYIASMLAFENQLSIDHPEVTLTWPQDALAEASDQAKGISDRFVLLDFVVGALLIAFLILFTLRHRREHQLFQAGLSRIGTPKKTILLEIVIENFASLFLGSFVAFMFSLLIPATLSLAHFHANLLSIYQGWPKYPLLVCAALGLVSGSLMSGDKAWRRQLWIPYSVGTIFLLVFLQQNGIQELRFWLVPFAYTLIPSLIGYVILRSASLYWRKRNHLTYILFREHAAMWQGVTAILTLASILALIALSFDSGISRDVTARSRDEVPLDISLKTGPELIRPLDLGSTDDYEKLVPNTRAYPILRSGTAVRNESSVSDTLSLIGIPPAALRAMPDNSIRRLSTVIAPAQPSVEQGINIGTTSKILVTLRSIPKEVDMLAWFQTPRGTHISAIFASHEAARTLTLAGQVPTGSSLIAFEFRETSDYLSRRLHAMGEGSFSVPMLKGIGSIVTVSFDGHLQALSNKDWHQVNFPYEFNGGSLYLRPTTKEDIPQVIVDPLTAALATNGTLTLTGASSGYFQVRIGAIAKVFPSAGDRFAIMDLSQLQNEIGQTDLGATDPIELWVSTTHPSQYLARVANSPFRNLLAVSQQNIARELKADPANVGLSGAYRVAIFYALLLAIFMFASALPLLYNESRSVLLQLEAGGNSPRELRRSLRKASRLSTAVALLLGTGIGLLVGRLFISDSTPYASIILALLATMALGEIGSFLITRHFFAETTMVKS
jgi:hypothetical protein